MPAAPNKKQQLVRISVAFLVFAAGSIYQYYRNEHQNEALHAVFYNRIFGIAGVSTQLVYYSEQDTQITIKVDAQGLPETASTYKPLLVGFVCSEPFLKQKLLANKSITLDLRAPDRQAGHHVNLLITKARCHYNV